jgi:hypothetical protein
MWSLAVFMYTRGTAFTALSVPSSTWPNLEVLRAAGQLAMGAAEWMQVWSPAEMFVHGGEFAETYLASANE